jgi:flagellar motor switch protein FliM
MAKVKDVWSTFGEFEIEFKNFDSITDFCFEFMPSSIEVVEPVDLKMSSKELEGVFNDVLAKLQQYDMTLKKIILQQRSLITKDDEKVGK